MAKPILYFDMDGVLVDFESGLKQTSEATLQKFAGRLDEIPNLFSLMQPMEGALEAFECLSACYDTYILSTAPWANPSAWTDKLLWVKRYLGQQAYKRLILSHNKHLNQGDFLIDDRTKNGAGEFKGELILFGSDRFPNWEKVLRYLEPLCLE